MGLGGGIGLSARTWTTLSMLGQGIGVVEFLESSTDGSIRKSGGLSHGGDATPPERPCFDGGPTSPTSFVQVVKEVEKLVVDSLDGSCVIHTLIVVMSDDQGKAIPASYSGAVPNMLGPP